MPNVRAKNQTLIAIPMRIEFLNTIDESLQKIGFEDRSKFIRSAIMEHLKREGISVPKEWMLAPSRKGKGGRKNNGKKASNSKTVPKSEKRDESA